MKPRTTLALHDPNHCDCGHNPRHCIQDVEAFCRAIINADLAVGTRTTNGYTGGSHISAHDFDLCLHELINETWIAAQRYDGRGRLAGYLSWIIPKRLTDWKRETYQSTRYGQTPAQLTDDERNLVATIVDFTGPEVLDLVNTIDDQVHRDTLTRIVIPIVFGEKTLEDYSEEGSLTLTDINARIRRLGRYVQEHELLAA